MPATVTADQQLLTRCRDTGYTPGIRDVAALVALWRRCRTTRLDDTGVDRRSAAADIVTALARGDGGVAKSLLRTFAESDGDGRALCLTTLARIAQRIELEGISTVVLDALADGDPRVVREAARAVGKVSGVDEQVAEQRLEVAFDTAALPEQRAIVEALGRVGAESGLTKLRAVETTDPELARRIGRAVAFIERRTSRTATGGVALSGVLGEPTQVWLRCRKGAAPIVAEQARVHLDADECRASPIVVRDAATVAFQWTGDLEKLLCVRTALDTALVFSLPPGDDIATRIIAGLVQPQLVSALTTCTAGAPRFRLAFGSGGHRRGLAWRVATQLAESGSPLCNDSRDVSWTVEVDEMGPGRLCCVPKGADERFVYRQGDVPAASHPTIAALLAFTARPRASELVWDPFCGSGTELVECARLSSELLLCGTDVDERAIAVARTNTSSAELACTDLDLHQGDALTTRPGDGARRPSLIITNPPMGRRVAGDGSVRELLTTFVHRVGKALTRGGRLVWLSPSPKLTRQAGLEVGLAVEDREEIDMGGFWATLQVMRKPTNSSRGHTRR